MQLRLKHAELLIKNTSLPVTDIGFTSGFNSTEYFTAAFRQKYRHAPARFRSVHAEKQKSKIS
jgi:transcriptional regulator GlxA family with amidase domain